MGGDDAALRSSFAGAPVTCHPEDSLTLCEKVPLTELQVDIWDPGGFTAPLLHKRIDAQLRIHLDSDAV